MEEVDDKEKYKNKNLEFPLKSCYLKFRVALYYFLFCKLIITYINIIV